MKKTYFTFVLKYKETFSSTQYIYIYKINFFNIKKKIILLIQTYISSSLTKLLNSLKIFFSKNQKLD